MLIKYVTWYNGELSPTGKKFDPFVPLYRTKMHNANKHEQVKIIVIIVTLITRGSCFISMTMSYI